MPKSNSSANLLRNSCIVMALTLLGGFVAWWLSFQMLFHEPLIVNAPISQGGHATLQTDLVRGPANGRCEIVAPTGAVVASFVSIAGGSDNGWRVQVNSSGFGQTPSFIVETPENAPIGDGYIISTARYLWPQSSARFSVVAKDAPASSSFVPQSTPTPVAMSVPGERADLAIRNLNDKEYLGGELYGDEGEDQTAEQVAVADKPSVYLIKVQNKGAQATSFKVNVEGIGPGWTGHYFDAPVGGREISHELSRQHGWRTPFLAVNDHIVLRVEIRRGNAAGVAATTLFRVSNAGGVTLDTVRATVSMQSIARVEVTVDGGKNWKTATSRGITVPHLTRIGFRAIKKVPTLPWPNEPLKPGWHTSEANDVGTELWIQVDKNENTVVTAQCGNAIETKLHVVPDE